MSTFHLILVAGLVLGLVQLASGIAIGLWLGRRGEKKPTGMDAQRAHKLAVDLQGVTMTMTESVELHLEQLAMIDERLQNETKANADDSQAPLTDLVVGVVGEMLAANQRLQSELCDVRTELDLRAAEVAEYLKKSLTDPLTQLPNRRALEDHLKTRMEAWRKHQTPFCVLMVDVDYFKRFNDTHGHQAGDAALVAVGRAMSRVLRNHDVVSRYGGEEFAILLPYAEIDELVPAVTKVLAAVADLQISTDEGDARVTVSAGLAGIRLQEQPDALVARADQALYAAKQNGRNRAYQHTGEAVIPLCVSEEFAGEANSSTDDSLSDVCADLKQSLASFLDQNNDARDLSGAH